MTHSYLVARLNRAGIPFEKSAMHPTQHWAHTSTHSVRWFASAPTDHVTPYVLGKNQEDDMMTDYFPGSFCDSWDDVVSYACEGDPRYVAVYVAIMEKRRARWEARCTRHGWAANDNYYGNRIAEAKALVASPAVTA